MTISTPTDLDALRLELSVKAKNGINFILAAAIVWALITYVWTLSYTAYDRAVLTFMVGGLMLPLAWVISKVVNTAWTVEGNPLDSLGLWLNFAQLFYFPILVFVLIRNPGQFVMVYIIITGAHFFPYAWYYKATSFAVMAGVLSVGAMLIGLSVPPTQVYWIPLFAASCLLVLAVWLMIEYRRNKRLYESLTAANELV